MIHSRDENNIPKPTQSSKYKPLQISDETVYDMAQHWYTAEEIADRFSITKVTLLARWGDAFHAGKADGFGKPRMLLGNILKGFSNLDPAELCRPDVPVHNLLKAIELHAKKYEGMGTRQTVVHEGLEKKYDAVESTPLIIEKP